MEFFDRVKEEIKKQNTTQEWIAKKCNISVSTFKGWISKERVPNVKQAVAIAQTLGISVEYLVTGEKIGEDSLSIELHKNPKVKHLAELSLMLSDTRLDDLIGITEQWIEKQDITQESAG